MKQLQMITKNQRKRTLKLLQDTKNYLGIDGYLLMKKMLTTSIITERLQNKYHRSCSWISYEEFLQRNERAVKNKCNKEYIKNINGLASPTFFGILSQIVIKGTLIDTENAVLNKWYKEIGATI